MRPNSSLRFISISVLINAFLPFTPSSFSPAFEYISDSLRDDIEFRISGEYVSSFAADCFSKLLGYSVLACSFPSRLVKPSTLPDFLKRSGNSFLVLAVNAPTSLTVFPDSAAAFITSFNCNIIQLPSGTRRNHQKYHAHNIQLRPQKFL